MVFMCLLLLVVFGAPWWWLLPSCRRFRQEIRDASTPGYLSAPPTASAIRLLKRIARFVVWIHVGKVTVIGQENLRVNGGSVLTAPNHSHPLDNFLFPYLLNCLLDRPARFMVARGWMRALFGLSGWISARMGAFCVNASVPGEGRSAAEAAVTVLVSLQTLHVFPEGGVFFGDYEMTHMKTGVVRILKEAAAELGRPTYGAPIYVRYGRYPGKWIMRLPEPIRYAAIMANPWYFRRGVIVVIGTPISSDELPEDVHEATEFLRLCILKLDPSFPHEA